MMQNNKSEVQSAGQKNKYTFSQLISSVEDLKKKFEVLKSENKMLKENTDNILRQVINMESQLISNGCIIEKFKSKNDEAFDQLFNGSQEMPEEKRSVVDQDHSVTLDEKQEKRKGYSKYSKSSLAKQPEREKVNTTKIKIETVEEVKLDIKEEIDDDYQELEEEACLDAEEGETEAEYVEVQNTLKIETDDSQANIFDIGEMEVLIKPVKNEADDKEILTEDRGVCNSVTATSANETDSNSSSENDDDTDNDSDTDNENENVKHKEYSLKRLHMDLVEYLDRNRKKPKLTPTKKQSVSQEEETLYCVCKADYRADKPMIGCDGPCEDWYHFNCVGIPQDFRSIAEWYCEGCFLSITGGTRSVCLCGGKFEPAHELIRCRGRCRRLYHPGCLGLDNEDMVARWDKEGRGQCGFCNG